MSSRDSSPSAPAGAGRVRAELLRFLAAGLLNTGATFLLYLLLLRVLPYLVAYSIAYGVGILLSYVLTARFVFRQPLSWAGLLKFPAVYLAQYLLGTAILAALVDLLGAPKELAFVGVVAITIPVTFLLSRLLLVGRSPGSPPRGARPAAPEPDCGSD
jgi:putative flippase GtrA